MSGVVGAIEELRRELKRLATRVTELESENAVLREEVATLRRENGALREVLDETRRAGKRQAGPFSKGTPKNNPKKPGRKGGSGYGSQSRRAVPARVDETVVVGCPLICAHCGGEVELAGTARQYQIDVPPIEPTTREFAIDYGRCRRCGRRVQGRDARQTSNATGAVGAVQIGPNAIALTAHLNKSCGMSYERIAEILSQVFRLTVSRSTLARALLRLSGKAEPTYRELLAEIREAPVVYPDETGWRIGGLKAWLWTATTLTATVYLIERGRGSGSGQASRRDIRWSDRGGRLGAIQTVHTRPATTLSGAPAPPLQGAS